MFDALVLWLHILGAVVFVGPQVFLAAIAMPAIRTMQDAVARREVTRAVTRGFGYLGGGALVVLLVTGLWNFSVAQEANRFEFTRYFWLFNIKFLLFMAVVLLTALHAMVFGKRLEMLQERGATEVELAEARQMSMMASIATLGLSLIILLLAALLQSEWAFQGGRRG